VEVGFSNHVHGMEASVFEWTFSYFESIEEMLVDYLIMFNVSTKDLFECLAYTMLPMC